MKLIISYAIFLLFSFGAIYIYILKKLVFSRKWSVFVSWLTKQPIIPLKGFFFFFWGKGPFRQLVISITVGGVEYDERVRKAKKAG